MTVDIIEEKKTESKSDPFKFDKLADAFVMYLAAKKTYPLHYAGRTYLYTGTHYREEPDLTKAVRKWFQAGDEKKKPQSNNVIGNVVPIVETIAYRSTWDIPKLPAYIGNDDFPKNVIAYDNGLLDLDAWLSGGKADLIPHTSKWLSTFALPYSFDPSADCPRWQKFLMEVFEGDEERIRLLQEYFGYCLTADTSKQKALVLVGKPRGGKGTCQHVLQKLMGDENYVAYDLGQLVKEFGLSPLVNRSVAIIGEVELQSNPHRASIMEKLKCIIGEDSQLVNVKHEKLQTAHLPTRFVIACNSVPHFFDSSRAIGTRFLFLPFNQSFVGRMNEHLKDELATEIEGISVWALEGLRRLRENKKFTVSAAHTRILANFNRDSAPIASFVEDCLVVHRHLNPGDLNGTFVDGDLRATKREVYERYVEWCDEHEIRAAEMNYFARDLRQQLPKLTETRLAKNIVGVRVIVWNGVGLKMKE